MNQRQQSKIVRPADLKADYHLSDTTIRGWEEQNLFPRRRKFGPRVTGWFRDDFEVGLRRISSDKSPVVTATDLNRSSDAVTAMPIEEPAQ